jgi:hypothetical protein
MDMGVWLRGLGLEQCAPAFHDNVVDGEVLGELTAGGFKDLGVTLASHVRTLLAAITSLRAGTPAVAGSAASATSATTYPRKIDAERRQLFCDLVGLTAPAMTPRICAR